MRKKTTEEFIRESKDKFGEQFDYSNVSYDGLNKEVILYCKHKDKNGNEHGYFTITPQRHLVNKGGCKLCQKQNSYDTQENFIEESIRKHHTKYDYSKVQYINCNTEVCIICPEHGEFWQTPHNHKRGYGCPSCACNQKKTTQDFIKEAQKIHGDKYDYSKSEYIGANEKICIICPIHGEFWQKSIVHINGHGCPCCNESKLERDVRVALTLNNISYIQQYKDKWLDKQSLGFFLPDYNIAIECQGEQHFKPLKFGNISEEKAFEKFRVQIENDKIKYEKCKKNGIKLLYYTKNKQDENYINNVEDLMDKLNL